MNDPAGQLDVTSDWLLKAANLILDAAQAFDESVLDLEADERKLLAAASLVLEVLGEEEAK